MNAMEDATLSKKSANAQLVELQNRNIYDVRMIQSLLDAFSKPSFFIGFFSLQPVNVIFTLKSSLGFEESESTDGNQIADHWVSCDNTVIQLKQMTIENVKGGYYEVYLTIRSYLVLELLKQMFFSFFFLSVSHTDEPFSPPSTCSETSSTSAVRRRATFPISTISKTPSTPFSPSRFPPNSPPLFPSISLTTSTIHSPIVPPSLSPPSRLPDAPSPPKSAKPSAKPSTASLT